MFSSLSTFFCSCSAVAPTSGFGGGVRPFTELPQWALRAAPGDARLGKHTRLDLELSFPGPQVGDRSYLIQFDGVSLVVVLAANDSVQVELIELYYVAGARHQSP